jgi:hypothetical protein
MLQEHELTEPLVSGKENTVAPHGGFEDFVVLQAWVHLGDVIDLVTVASEGLYDRSVDVSPSIPPSRPSSRSVSR